MALKFLTQIFGSRNDRLLKQYRKTVERINALESSLEPLSDDALRAKTDEFKKRVAGGEALEDPVQWKAMDDEWRAALGNLQARLDAP